MPLDSTPFGPNADTYITVAEADQAAADLGLSGWTEKTAEEKEAALRLAALDVDSHRFHDPELYSSQQARSFPRAKDGGVIPKTVKRSQMFQAHFLATSGSGDLKFWRGEEEGPMKDAGVGSPLCPRAYLQLARHISRAGEVKD